MLTSRQSGLLLHPTSLSGPEGFGTLGNEARYFVDYLVRAGQSVWQILPLGPTGHGDCPYSSFSAFAGNPDLISLSELANAGDLKSNELPPPACPEARIDFAHWRTLRYPLLKKAAERFLNGCSARKAEFEQFCATHADWLNDYAFYRAMRAARQHKPWFEWPAAVRAREEAALHEWGNRLAAKISFEKYLQFCFFTQWFALKEYANARGVEFFGDLPIFVAQDSADVWANQQLFQLDSTGRPRMMAGVPPDYFSESGQLWGNPLYDWDAARAQNYSWWQARLRWNLSQCDRVRIDHFRGFAACWAVPQGESSAENGHWQPGPGADFFHHLHTSMGDLPLVAEDLGVITPDVEKLRDDFDLPGMKILQFAFDSGPRNPYLPHHYPQNAVVYTGTHDNTTTLAWWQSLDAGGKQRVRDYLDSRCRDMPWPLIRYALASCARLAIFPLQDLLKLGAAARMNHPGTATGNWNWRLLPGQLEPVAAERLAGLCRLFDRPGPQGKPGA